MNILNKYRHLSAFMLLGPLCFAQYQFEVKDASKNYSAVIQIEDCLDGRCGGKGTVELFDNKNTKIQTFTSDDLIVYLAENRKLLSGKMNSLTKEESPIVINDFNFDGSEDIAIRNGNMGNYNGASYDVYVFNSTRLSFVKSKELTELASNALDMFNVDSERKRLISYGKSGCCNIFTIEYAVIPNKGLDKVLVKEEDKTEEDRVKVTIKEKIKDKWVTRKKVYSLEEYNKEK
ncbi:XAC2610-related protein [Chryseobacterium sp. JK1]|uniref:XAC2610-related protein n=1 Tax=Chryseobacterium sp. JK1 TaxID=874294 RepID=UPI003D68F228